MLNLKCWQWICLVRRVKWEHSKIMLSRWCEDIDIDNGKNEKIYVCGTSNKQVYIVVNNAIVINLELNGY